MGIIIDSITFDNEFQPQSTTWLLANIGEKITATIDFTVRADIIPNGLGVGGGQYITCAPTNYPTDNYIQTFGFAGFADFNLGDLIFIEDSGAGGANTGTYTIIEKISDSIVRVDANLTFSNITASSDSISLLTPMEAIRYNWNLISNTIIQQDQHLLIK